jgi:hypothetical protein
VPLLAVLLCFYVISIMCKYTSKSKTLHVHPSAQNIQGVADPMLRASELGCISDGSALQMLRAFLTLRMQFINMQHD